LLWPERVDAQGNAAMQPASVRLPVTTPASPPPSVELATPPAPAPSLPAIVPGSLDHRDLLVRWFRETHVVYDPARVHWPVIDEADKERLRGLPVWDEALRTEFATAKLVQAYASREDDAEMRSIVALQGYEEARHSQLIDAMVAHYGIHPVPTDRPAAPPDDMDPAFLRMGYGECMDSFFAFGLFHVASRSKLFPPQLVALFEPLMQEEARHIIFFVNWLAWHRARSGRLARARFRLRCAGAFARQLFYRVRGVLGLEEDRYFTKGHAAIDLEITPGEFLDLCQAENARRLGAYDPRLLKPTLVPRVARFVRRFLK
jgi:hypothetical protein